MYTPLVSSYFTYLSQYKPIVCFMYSSVCQCVSNLKQLLSLWNAVFVQLSIFNRNTKKAFWVFSHFTLSKERQLSQWYLSAGMNQADFLMQFQFLVFHRSLICLQNQLSKVTPVRRRRRRRHLINLVLPEQSVRQYFKEPLSKQDSSRSEITTQSGWAAPQKLVILQNTAKWTAGLATADGSRLRLQGLIFTERRSESLPA